MGYHPLPTSGLLTIKDIAREKGICGTSGTPASVVTLGIEATHDLNYSNAITIIEAITTKPYSLSDWYGYNHNATGIPIVQTLDVTNIGPNYATLNGVVLWEGNLSITDYGFYISLASDCDPEDAGTMSYNNVWVSGYGDYTDTYLFFNWKSGMLNNTIDPETTYYVRVYATNSAGEGLGEVVEFTTDEATVPLLTTNATTNITPDAARFSGIIDSNGGSTVTGRGFLYGLASGGDPATEIALSAPYTLNEDFEYDKTGLTASSDYHIRCYADNSIGRGYGLILDFTTDAAGIPIVETTGADNIGTTTAHLTGYIFSAEGSTLEHYGFKWDTVNPPTANSYEGTTSTVGSKGRSISSLPTSTLIYYRFYAINGEGTAWGIVKSFTTGAASIPTVILNYPSSIKNTELTISANVTYDGGDTVTERGVCYDTSSSPTTSDSTALTGSGTGGYSGTISNLTVGYTYYFRAYATNSIGTAYSNEISILMSGAITAPVVTTNRIVNGGDSTGEDDEAWVYCTPVSNGNDGDCTFGVCMGTSENPTTQTQATGITIGTEYNVHYSSLSTSTTYYFRAYASNSVGITYGINLSIGGGGELQLAYPPVFQYNPTDSYNLELLVTAINGTSSSYLRCYYSSVHSTMDEDTDYYVLGAKLEGQEVYRFGFPCYLGYEDGNPKRLDHNTLYYFRIYFKSRYSSSMIWYFPYSYTTRSSGVLPVVDITEQPEYYTTETAHSGGNLLCAGSSHITSYGVCWNTATTPTILNYKWEVSYSLFEALTFSSPNMMGYDGNATNPHLIVGYTYYVRAFATNSTGTGYGPEKTYIHQSP